MPGVRRCAHSWQQGTRPSSKRAHLARVPAHRRLLLLLQLLLSRCGRRSAATRAVTPPSLRRVLLLLLLRRQPAAARQRAAGDALVAWCRLPGAAQAMWCRQLLLAQAAPHAPQSLARCAHATDQATSLRTRRNRRRVRFAGVGAPGHPPQDSALTLCGSLFNWLRLTGWYRALQACDAGWAGWEGRARAGIDRPAGSSVPACVLMYCSDIRFRPQLTPACPNSNCITIS